MALPTTWSIAMQFLSDFLYYKFVLYYKLGFSIKPGAGLFLIGTTIYQGHINV